MKHNLTKRFVALCLSVLLLLTVSSGCGKNKGNPEPATILTGCTVTVQTEGGLPLANVDVSIYSDKAKSELIDFVRTDENGVAKLNMDIPSGSVIFLDKVPEGYAVADCYSLTEKDTMLSLKAVSGSELAPIKLGGVMFDFTVSDQNGTEYTLSKLLESKKAVVLNLWYTNCVPCKMEFPFLQQAYNEYKDDIALLALNPVDDANAIAAFAAENGLTLPMAACDPDWANQIEGIAYPTTIVIDRFGTIVLIHIGSVDTTATFKNLFAHFVADDYKQATFEDINAFASQNDEPIGTASNPYVHTGDGSFTVKVEPAQTVYYTLFGVDGFNLSVNSDTMKLVCDEKEYTPNKGKISFPIKATDATAPVMVQFTNTGSEAASYKVMLSAPEGAATNPISMKDGNVTVKLEEGNQRGVYYLYKAAYEGTFTIECKNTVSYTVSVRNLSGKETATLDKNTKKATIDVRKNDEIQILVTAVAKDGHYPATEAKLNVSSKKAESVTTPNDATTNNSSDKTPTTNSGTSATTGKLVNPDAPIEFGGVLDFKAEVNAGEMVLYHVFRVGGTTLHIKDATAYVIYGDKTYKPDKNGNISFPVTSDSPNNPIVLKIGNSGKANKEYAVNFSFPEGSLMNPYDLKAGTIKTKIAANNDQGVYYSCIADKDGYVTIVLKSVTAGVQCDIRVTVTDSSLIPVQHLLSETEDGKTLTVEVYAGDEIEINFVALPDENFKYPAATIESVLSFS